MHFPTETRSVVFVSWERKLNSVSGLIGLDTFVSCRLKSSLGGSVFQIDLDFLKTKKMRPLMSFQEGSQWSKRDRPEGQLLLE